VASAHHRQPAAWIIAAIAALVPAVLVLLPGAARATYTGAQEVTAVGTVAAGGGWIAVPQYQYGSDPGEIDGTPSSSFSSWLEVAPVSGYRHVSFRSVQPNYSPTMGPMLVAGGRRVLVAGWSDYAAPGRIDTATLSASGHLPAPASHIALANEGSLRLSSGPDGAYAVSWQDPLGLHGIATPVGSPPTALLGPDVPLEPADQVVLSGGDSYWLVTEGGGLLSASPATFGQDSPPPVVSLGNAAGATTLGDGSGGLWILARGGGTWFAVHVDRAGGVNTTPLPAGTTNAVMALAGRAAVIAYRTRPHCATYIERLRPGGAPSNLAQRSNISPRTGRCSTLNAIVVDPASATAYVAMSARNTTTLTTETSGGKRNTWSALLHERLDALVAAGSNRVVMESNGPERDTGEACGGAEPSSARSYVFRIFQGARRVRSGRLEASTVHC
jgi:hypothetical protein